MNRTLAFTRRAQADVENAFEWYELQRIGLGGDFLEAIAGALDLIWSMPAVGRHIPGDVRRFRLHRFPFSVFYSAREGLVKVHGCLHDRRDTRDWHLDR